MSVDSLAVLGCISKLSPVICLYMEKSSSCPIEDLRSAASGGHRLILVLLSDYTCTSHRLDLGTPHPGKNIQEKRETNR